MANKIFTTAEEFIYRKRHCLLIRISFDDPLINHISPIASSYNGYTIIKKLFNQDDYVYEELNFMKKLDFYEEDTWAIGFDTNHYRDVERPETQTHGAVKARLKRLVDELINLGY